MTTSSPAQPNLIATALNGLANWDCGLRVLQDGQEVHRTRAHRGSDIKASLESLSELAYERGVGDAAPKARLPQYAALNQQRPVLIIANEDQTAKP